MRTVKYFKRIFRHVTARFLAEFATSMALSLQSSRASETWVASPRAKPFLR
jgi:hypothetical protein